MLTFVFYSTFTNVFLFLSRFYVFNVFFYFGGEPSVVVVVVGETLYYMPYVAGG